MFDRFGEFDSAEELNAAAAGLLAEGDIDSLYALAEENGIDREDAEDYVDGVCPELASPFAAAWGKLQVESKDTKVCHIMEDWLHYIEHRLTERPEMIVAVRKKGNSLKGCIAYLLKWGFENQYKVDKEILKAAGLKKTIVDAGVTMGTPGMGTAKKLIDEYYLGSSRSRALPGKRGDAG